MKFYTNVRLYGNSVQHIGYENGNKVKFKVNFKPTLYLKSKKDNSKFKTIYEEPVDEFFPGTIRETRDFVKEYEDVDNFKIYGNTGYVYQYIASLYPKHEAAEYDMNLIRICTLDIETECENGFPNPKECLEKVNVITLICQGITYVFGVGEFDLSPKDNLKVYKFDDEKYMLLEFLKVWQQIDPDIISGWYVRSFDIPYLVGRITRLLGEDYTKNLSPWEHIESEEIEIRGKLCEVFKIAGISILDYYELYRKYTYNQLESFSLNSVCRHELGKTKIDYSDYENIKDFYTKNFQKFVEYNVEDVNLVLELDQKLHFLKLHIDQAYTAKVNYEDVYAQTRVWDAIIYNHLLSKNIVIPLKQTVEKTEQFMGAYVKESKLGMYNWIVSFDVASMYPNIIRLLNLSPETILDKKERYTIEDLLVKKIDLSNAIKEKYTVAANGTCYKKDKQGFMSELVGKFFELRKSYKIELKQLKNELLAVNNEIEDRKIK